MPDIGLPCIISFICEENQSVVSSSSAIERASSKIAVSGRCVEGIYCRFKLCSVSYPAEGSTKFTELQNVTEGQF